MTANKDDVTSLPRVINEPSVSLNDIYHSVCRIFIISR